MRLAGTGTWTNREGTRVGAVVLVLAAGAIGCLALNLPGHLSYDSVQQLAQGRAGVYNTWHPPVMAWLLGLGDRLLPGVAVFVGLQTALVFGGLALFATAGRARWRTAAVAAMACVLPQLVIYPAIVWKDVLFAGAAVAGFGALAQAAACWERPNRRWAWVLACGVLLTLAALTRQNGGVLLPAAASALGVIAFRRATAGRLRVAAAAAGGFLLATAVLLAAVSVALNTRTDGQPERLHQIADLQTYDIVGMVKADPALPLPILQARAPGVERQLRTAGVAAYTPERIDPLVRLDGLVRDRDRNKAAVGAQWRQLVVKRPDLYVRVRAELFRWIVAKAGDTACIPIYVGVDGPEPLLRRLGLGLRSSPRDAALEDYGGRFVGGPLLSHLTFLVLGVGLMVLFVTRGRPTDLAAAGLLAGAFLFAASFFPLSVACDYRYLYELDLSVLAAALYAVGGARRDPASTPA